jgi:hypothetical protein
MLGGLNHFARKTLRSRGRLPSKETAMSVKSISVVAAFGVLSSVAIALTVTPSDFGAYPTRADFDWIFAKFATASAFEAENVAADREKIRGAALKRMNLGQFGKE